MKLITSELLVEDVVSESLIVREGIQVEDAPFAQFLVGSPSTTERSFTRVPAAVPFAKTFTKAPHPCPRDGNGDLGKCGKCGMEVTPQNVTKVIQGSLPNGINLYKATAVHNPVQKYEPVKRGSFIVTRKKKTVLLVEEFNWDRYKRVAVLMYARAPRGGYSIITASIRNRNAMIADIHARAFGSGSSWSDGSPKGKMGAGVERLFILEPGDEMLVRRDSDTGHRRWAPVRIVVHPDFSLEAIEEPLKVEAPVVIEKKETPKAPETQEVSAPESSAETVQETEVAKTEADEPTPEEIAAALPEGGAKSDIPPTVEAMNEKLSTK